MGYYTSFSGSIAIDPPLSPEHEAYLKKFCESRRMKREPIATLTIPDPLRVAVGLPLGEESEYFIGGDLNGLDHRDPGIININSPPASQPGLWCSWKIFRDRIEGPEEIKFYGYVEWLAYMIGHFFEPWGYKLNGSIEWRGEDREDEGVINVEDNAISISELKREFVVNEYSTNDAMEIIEISRANRAANMRGTTT